MAANSLLSLKSESETTEEDLLLTLPGYRPKKVAAKATTLDPKGSDRVRFYVLGLRENHT